MKIQLSARTLKIPVRHFVSERHVLTVALTAGVPFPSDDNAARSMYLLTWNRKKILKKSKLNVLLKKHMLSSHVVYRNKLSGKEGCN